MYDQTPVESWKVYANDPKELGTGIILRKDSKSWVKSIRYVSFIISKQDSDIVAIKWIAHKIASEEVVMNKCVEI